jgi:hypothetical protein
LFPLPERVRRGLHHVFQKVRHFRQSHFTRMPLVVKQDERTRPGNQIRDRRPQIASGLGRPVEAVRAAATRSPSLESARLESARRRLRRDADSAGISRKTDDLDGLGA